MTKVSFFLRKQNCPFQQKFVARTVLFPTYICNSRHIFLNDRIYMFFFFNFSHKTFIEHETLHHSVISLQNLERP